MRSNRAGGFVFGAVRPALEHGIIETMKSFLAIASLLILASIACTANTSVGPQQVAKATTEPQPSQHVASPGSQDKVPCALKIDGAPVFDGLSLGMTSDQVLALFPGSKEDSEVHSNLSRPPSQFGQSSFVIRPEKFSSRENFPGINQITFTLLDGRVSSMSFGYNGPEYSHVDKFVAKVVAGTNLPPVDQWEAYVGMDNQLKILACSEFEVRVFAGGQGGNLNYVLLKDLLADKKLKERRAKAAQQAPKPSP